VSQLKRRTRAGAVERSLDGGLRRRVAFNDLDDPRVNAGEAIRQREPLGEFQLSDGDQTGFVGGTGDDGPSGAAGSRVDAQDSPSLTQDAASETASSSNDRFA
jgi:hypothetical protein